MTTELGGEALVPSVSKDKEFCLVEKYAVLEYIGQGRQLKLGNSVLIDLTMILTGDTTQMKSINVTEAGIRTGREYW